ncbi:MAG: NAD kinase [Chitinophagales bacterium]|nr:NAD kinase [Chitinophagales bacterium]MDW8273406.1 NAD kinase [Chitinophagales bacterium]
MIAVYGKNLNPANAPYLQKLFDCLKKYGIKLSVNKDFFHLLREKASLNFEAETYEYFDAVKDKAEFVFSIGGDGTILECVTFIKDSGTPIVGINFGRLGFLANIGKDHIEGIVEALNRSNYIIDKRTLIALECNKPLFVGANFALNEMTIQRKDNSSMITVHTYLNGELLNSYWADGLIVSTPTGSTGYSLSCGGPILYPTSGNFVITPVAPHNLNVRPMVVSDDVVLSFEVTGRSNSFLCTLDSRFETIDSTYQIAIRKADFQIKLVRLNDMNFLYALKNKLHWGIDQRN